MTILGQSHSADHSIKVETNFDLDEWAERLGPKLTKGFLFEARKYVLDEIRRRFMNSVDPEGKPWKKLHPATIRRKKGYRAILRNKDRLMKSFKGVVYEDEMIVGTNIKYAPVHQHGAIIIPTPKQSVWMFHKLFGSGKRGRSKGRNTFSPFSFTRITIPARPFIGWGRKDKAILLSKLRKEVKATERMGTRNV